jgi:hypothetical protein
MEASHPTPKRKHREYSDDEIRRRIAKTAAKATTRMPDHKQCASFPNKVVGRFLSSLRDLVAEGTTASSWTEDDLDNFAIRLEWIDLAFESGAFFTLAKSGGYSLPFGTEGGQPPQEPPPTSCTFECKAEKDACLAQCPGPDEPGGSFPCRCCADCRFAYIACLADCIWRYSAWDTVGDYLV